ncbi:threonine aldolase family protein [Indioceanicola profundi]|uniref:threonine aldolase family protein n=1 Tax=Indioceanicola profundi TaxID=2220096 RepID=UPI000E6A99B1|nr:low specificity L-threonine aldolase [Indioceanicola profundi]
MNFKSDNVTGAAPEIVAALIEANGAGPMSSYGDDPITARVQAKISDLFGTDCAVFPVATGTAANSLALAALTPPWGAVYCHADSHINTDECGAPEMYTAGAKLVTLQGENGKISAGTLSDALANAHIGFVHAVQPKALSLTQATEAGTVYSPAEVGALAEAAKRHGMRVHMDGARFANAVASLGCHPADVTWRAGVDVLSFGATKNGAMAAEAVVFFDKELAAEFGYRRKRAAHLFSKMRFLSAQLDAYVTDGLWLRLATHANAMARQLAEGLGTIPGVELQSPVEANEVFIALPEEVIAGLEAKEFGFYRWEGNVIRLVTAWCTKVEDVQALLSAARELAH